jgi:hypothetical protein
MMQRPVKTAQSEDKQEYPCTYSSRPLRVALREQASSQIVYIRGDAAAADPQRITSVAAAVLQRVGRSASDHPNGDPQAT